LTAIGASGRRDVYAVAVAGYVGYAVEVRETWSSSEPGTRTRNMNKVVVTSNRWTDGRESGHFRNVS
jgi:hypothetical protein